MLSNKAIKKKIEKFSKLLGISDYSFYVGLVSSKAIKNPDCENYALVDTDEDTREACIRLNKTLLSKKPEELDRTLIHELLHVRFSEFAMMIRLLIKSYVKDKKARQMYLKQFDQLEHKIIIPIADALVKKWQTQS